MIGLRQQCLNCYNNGRMIQFEWDRHTVLARVDGLNGKQYEVEVELGRRGTVESASCSCPVAEHCRHIGAVLLTCL